MCIVVFGTQSLSENISAVNFTNFKMYYPVSHVFSHRKMCELMSLLLPEKIETATAASLVFNSYLLLHDHNIDLVILIFKPAQNKYLEYEINALKPPL